MTFHSRVVQAKVCQRTTIFYSVGVQQKTKFFDDFVISDGFIRIPNNDIHDEFERLAKHMEWDQDDLIKIELYACYKEMFLDSLKIKNPEEKRNLEEIKNEENNSKNDIPEPMNQEKILKNENNSKNEIEFGHKKDSQTIENQNFTIDYSFYNIPKKKKDKNETFIEKSKKKQKTKPKTASEYFVHFEKFMKFPYNKNNNHLMEFEKMAKYFKWDPVHYKAEKNKLMALVEEEKKLNSKENIKTKNTKLSEKPNFNQNCETKNTKFVEESSNFPNSKLSQSNKNQQNVRFFDDYVRDYKFELIASNDHHTEFNRLAKHMNWTKKQLEIHRLVFHESMINDWAENDLTNKTGNEEI